jgi:aminoglycoside phosphotransferase (APT) family kinase protein
MSGPRNGAIPTEAPPSDATADAADRAEALGLLERLGLASTDGAVVESLSGGVSSDIWLVRTGERSLVLKRPRQRLKVAADWRAPIDRGASEAAWLDYVGSVVPGACPSVLAYDPGTYAIALEYLDPASHRNWKSLLMAGEVDAGFAGAVGRDLGRIHRASAGTPELRPTFDHQDLFETLRIEPYLVRAAAAAPEVRELLEAVIAGLRSTRIALVHGDVSPKNILVGDRPVFLDAECATWGDPAFDASFCLTHLALKEIHLPQAASAFRDAAKAFETRYLAEVDWESADETKARIVRIVPALMLARVAGASPVEYLGDAERKTVGRIARAALVAGRPIEEIIDEEDEQEGATHG